MHLAPLLKWDLFSITNLVMDCQNDGVAKALGTLFFALFSFPPPSFPNLPEQTLSKRSFARVYTVSLESLFLLAFRALIRFLEEKYHSMLFRTI